MTAGTGYRRRILIEPQADRVTAELEDDYHRMVVTLRHEAGVVQEVQCAMKRAPWTSCPGAMEQLRATFTGVALADVARRGEKLQNCTHLHDLTLFAAAHAKGTARVAYDVFVTDLAEGRRRAMLRRDGALLLDWSLEGDEFLTPADLEGLRLRDLGPWIAAQDEALAEAGRILRWAAILAHGREIVIPAGLSATAFPSGSCYTFQPERARDATRLEGADIDFSLPGAEPMQDRADAFPAVPAGKAG
ncbi:MAG TPA: DUF2889 domain-containing protein [Sphingobium sp.]|nr:DUF2889 domain-containing protein [Sphingobium sp.]